MNQEAIKKLRLAHKYQKEALMELVPENIRGNVLNIEKEIKEIGLKCITGTGAELMKAFMGDASKAGEEEQKKQPDKLKKVEIR